MESYAASASKTLDVAAIPNFMEIDYSQPPVAQGVIETTVIPELAGFNLTTVNGSLIYDLPKGGIDISEELYEKLSGKKPDHDLLTKRYCENPCNCGTHKVWHLDSGNWNKFLGKYKVLSAVLCGPGTITNTFSEAYTYTVAGQIDPSIGIMDGKFLSKLGLKLTFQYSFGNVVATGYGGTCGQYHPCVSLFRPWIGVVKGRGRWTQLSNDGNKLCGSGYGGDIEIHLPIVKDCNDKQCGADGVWSHCYYLGNYAKAMCHTLGPTPKDACPDEVYPK